MSGIKVMTKEEMQEAIRHVYDGFNSMRCFIEIDREKHGDIYADLKEELLKEFCDALMSSGVMGDYIPSSRGKEQ